MELVIFVGLQGSGKSTFYRSRFASTHFIISKDLMGGQRRGDRQKRQLHDALRQGRSVVVDNTNPTAAERAELIAIGLGYGARILGYYFDVNIKDCLERNRQRTGKMRVPDVALFATRRKLQPPSYAEGFQELYRVQDGPDGPLVEPIPR
jgi:predicted kinase